MYTWTDVDHLTNEALDYAVSAKQTLDDLARALRGVREEPNIPPLVHQCNPEYAHQDIHADCTLSICEAGCLLCSVYSLALWSGYEGILQQFAYALELAGAFRDCELSQHAVVSKVHPNLLWDSGVWIAGKYSSFADWHNGPADVQTLEFLLAMYPVVVKVDYIPTTPAFDRHYVLAYQYIPPHATASIEDDLLVMDPATGTLTSILTYFNPDWLHDGTMPAGCTKVARTVYGMRVWAATRTE